MPIIPLDLDAVRENIRWRVETDRTSAHGQMRALQAAVYVMCNGGMLGASASEQPGQFYVDDRVGRLPYSRRAIYQAVAVLKLYAEALGLDANNLPKRPAFHNCGVW